MSEASWPIAGPLDLRRTLRALGGPASGPDGVHWYATRTRSGPASVALRSNDARVEARAYGPGAADLLADVPRLLGFDDDPDAFDPAPGLMRDLHLRSRGLRLGSTGAVYETMLPIVIGQVVTTQESKASYRRLLRDFGDPAPGPNERLRLPPPANRLATLGYEQLHALGIERRRAGILIEVARRARRLEEALAMSPDAARARLRAVRGIGPWTAEQVMGTAWGDRDAIPTGDYHLPNLVSWALAGEPRAGDERMLELLEPYRPMRRRALVLLKQSGIHAPKYGPRTPIRSHL